MHGNQDFLSPHLFLWGGSNGVFFFTFLAFRPECPIVTLPIYVLVMRFPLQVYVKFLSVVF